jgi:outer membrane receptor protein involved in Fe transport
MDFNRRSWVDNAGRRRPYSTRFPDDFSHPSDPHYDLDVEGGVLYWIDDGQRVPLTTRMEQETKDWFVQAGVGYKGFNLRALHWHREESEGPWYTPQKRISGVWIPTGSAINAWYEHQFSSNLQSKTYVIYRESGLDEDSNDASFSAHFTGDTEDPLELRIYSLGPPLFYSLDNSEWRIGQQLNWNLDSAAFVVGGEYTLTRNSEDYNSRYRTDAGWNRTPRHEERNLGLFGNAQVDVNGVFSLAAGLRFDYNSLHGEEGGFESLYTGRLAAVYTPNQSHYAKLIYAESFQVPDSWHRFATDHDIRPLPAPHLKAEKLATFEAVYGYLAKGKWESSVSLYHSQITDLIGTVEYEYEGATVTRFDNVGSLRVLGCELESRYLIAEDKSVYGNLTVTSAEDTTSDRKTGDIAPLKANLGCDLLFNDRWGVSARLHYVSDRDTVNWDSDSIYSVRTVDDYVTVDLTLSVLGIVKGVDLRASIYNLFDSTYYDPGPRAADGVRYNAAILQEPLHLFVGLSYRF